MKDMIKPVGMCQEMMLMARVGLDEIGQLWKVICSVLFIAERLGEVGDWLEVLEIGAGMRW